MSFYFYIIILFIALLDSRNIVTLPEVPSPPCNCMGGKLYRGDKLLENVSIHVFIFTWKEPPFHCGTPQSYMLSLVYHSIYPTERCRVCCITQYTSQRGVQFVCWLDSTWLFLLYFVPMGLRQFVFLSLNQTNWFCFCSHDPALWTAYNFKSQYFM